MDLNWSSLTFESSIRARAGTEHFHDSSEQLSGDHQLIAVEQLPSQSAGFHDVGAVSRLDQATFSSSVVRTSVLSSVSATSQEVSALFEDDMSPVVCPTMRFCEQTADVPLSLLLLTI